jgi:uncharacterized membrane protein YgcG
MIAKLLRWSAAACVAVALNVVLSVAPAHAQIPDFVEHIKQFDVKVQINKNGSMRVTETIAYHFGNATGKHGIFRDIIVRQPWSPDPDYERVYRISNVKVSSPDAPAGTKETREGRTLNIRIGDPDRTVSGTRHYVISYDVAGAPLTYEDHDEVYWNAIGLQWPVTILNARVQVVAPASVTQVACYTGPEGSTLPCDRSTKTGKTATFAQNALSPYSGLTFVVAMPKGTIQPPPAPILDKKWNIDDAFARRPDTLIPAGGIALLGVLGVIFLAWRRGRDRGFTGSAVDAAMGNTTGEEEPIPLFDKDEGPVEFIPPDGIRPGQVGLLIDEEANVLDVTATIVDLAVRGYLTIEELEPEGFFRRRHDYLLTSMNKASDEKLLAYERNVMSGLFRTGSPVKLSELKYKFAEDLNKVVDGIYKDAIAEGWYRRSPRTTRSLWSALGWVVLIAGVGLTVLAAARSSYGLVPLGLVVTGLAVIAVAKYMPARTAKGSAVYSRVRGFRRLFSEGEEDLRARFAEDHNIFSQYLPYAIVFGCAKKWAKVFEGLSAEELGTTGWYSGNNTFNALYLASAMDDFGTVATGTLYASVPSSSGGSGFSGGSSGGGGGGGGGGSW